MTIEVGHILEGVVVGITNFGAFVELPENVVGLIHISEVADTYVRDVKDFIQLNDRVKVKVINIDAKGKIGLSIKQLNTRPANRERRPSPSFEDKLARFIKDSDERQQDIRKNTDSKRGGRGSGRF